MDFTEIALVAVQLASPVLVAALVGRIVVAVVLTWAAGKLVPGVGGSAELTWQAEALEDDGGRPDLQARDADDAPAVKVEAKLGELVRHLLISRALPRR